MSVYGAYARMLNDLYFLNLDSVSTKLHRSLACSKCKRVFRKPYGLERHFKQVHVDNNDLEQQPEIGGATRGFTTSLEEVGQGREIEDPPMEVVGVDSPEQDPTNEDENPAQSSTPEEEEEEDASSSSSEDEPLISSEEEDAADPPPAPLRHPAAPPEVILLSSDEENDCDDDAFVDSSDTSSVVDSEAETLAEGCNGADSGFESNKASSPPVAGKALSSYVLPSPREG